MEEWKVYGKIPAFSVSNMGRVRKTGKLGKALVDIDIIPKHKGKYRLISDGTIYILLHILVADVWLPNPDNCDNVRHIDKNTRNNVLSNLERYSIKYKGGRPKIITDWKQELQDINPPIAKVVDDRYIVSPIPRTTKWSIPEHIGIYNSQKEAEESSRS